jgi:hypothetical protein
MAGIGISDGSRPTLSLMVMTKNGSWRLDRMLCSMAGKVSGNIVIGVDSATNDDTEERARRRTADVVRIRNPEGYIEPHIRTLFERCTGDWVIRLDDDELMSANFSLEGIDPTILDRFELIGFPRPWIVQRDPPLYIGTGRESGELVPQFRLMKRAAAWQFVKRIHTAGFEMKPAHVVRDMYLFHMNLVDVSIEDRRTKYEFYQSHRPAPWNETYLLDARCVAASPRALPCHPDMFPPLDLLRSTGSSFPVRP